MSTHQPTPAAVQPTNLENLQPTNEVLMPAMSTPLHTDENPNAEALTFSTRFGEVSIRTDRLLNFPHGLFGFRECTQFGLAKLPNVDGSPLLLMQCVNQPAIAFLVADPEALGIALTGEDKLEALAETKLAQGSTQFLTILTLYDAGENYYLTANLKAPVLIDSAAKTGVQFILSNKGYSTQHKV
jgi:flagellar assembly factor FliW